jgi:hypothetical protein
MRSLLHTKLLAFKETGEIEGVTEDGCGVWVNFPSSHSGFTRMLIHEICEELNIRHESHGEGTERYISIARPASLLSKRNARIVKDQVKEEVVAAADGADDESEVGIGIKSLGVLLLDDDDDNEEEVGDDAVAAPLPLGTSASPSLPVHDAPPMNTLLSQLGKDREERARIAKLKEDARAAEEKQKKKKKKSEKGGVVKSKEAALFASSDMDDMEFLESLAKVQNECLVKGCKEKQVGLYGSVCNLCKERYCFKHMSPEIHGCGGEYLKSKCFMFMFVF